MNTNKQIQAKKTITEVVAAKPWKQFKRISPQAGKRIGKWTLVSPIANQKNSFVWVCTNDDGNTFAFKALNRTTEEGYKRFVDETKVLEDLAGMEGIIPIFDKHLPSDPNDGTPYYIMPLAESADQLRKAPLTAKIDSVLSLAKTLSELHKRSIFHRDIKLPNILFYKGRYCFADFGLVDYPEKHGVSKFNEDIGPKFNMAPEMRRESSKADPEKADVFSFAKTFWTILTGSQLGFDGAYIAGSSIGIKRYYPDRYLYPLENLLTRCTDNDPEIRFTIDEVIEHITDWKELDANFHERNLQEWIRFQTDLLPTPLPQRTAWHKPQEIADILNRICSVSNLTHVFFPGHGGLDLMNAKVSREEGCLELDFGGVEIVKPKQLVFETFGDDFQWNYFRLELDVLEPLKLNGQDEFEEEDGREEVAELSPASYYPAGVIKTPQLYHGRYHIPYGARIVRRWFRGSFVIFTKRSYYNLTSATYDGRHDALDSDGFRNYIIKQIASARKQLQEAGIIQPDPELVTPPVIRNHELYEQPVYRCGYCGNVVAEDGSKLSHEDYQYGIVIIETFGSHVNRNVVGYCCKEEHKRSGS